MTPRRTLREQGQFFQTMIRIVKICSVYLLTVSFWQGIHAEEHPDTASAARKEFVKHIRTLPGASTPGALHRQVVAFLLRFVDFGCAVCLNNFLDVCDSLKSNELQSGKHQVVLIFQRDDTEESYQRRTLQRWSVASGLNYPIALAPAAFFLRHGIEYSTVAVIDNADEIEFLEKIPLSSQQQIEFLQTVFHLRR